VKASGLVVRSLYGGAVRSGRSSLDQFMQDNGVPGIAGVDTRRLTLKLRREGSRNGVVVRAPGRLQGEDPVYLGAIGSRAELLNDSEREALSRFFRALPSMEGLNLVERVTEGEAVSFNSGGSPRLLLLDWGAKLNIARELAALGSEVTVLPGARGLEERLAEGTVDGIVLSNGPGDPAVLQEEVTLVSRLVGSVPMLGVCLGHQLISEAIGAKTHKMKFGHHGANHPVRDERSRGVFVTSQNHGFAVTEESLPGGTDIRFRNANDSTIEGIQNEQLKLLTAQFHPEAAPGPHDCRFVFREFLESINAVTGAQAKPE
jgi:carbamoyl-phosphate synthase small subunit